MGEEKKDLESCLAEKNELFLNKIISMSAKMKNLKDLPDLLNVIYSERQIALEYYQAILQNLSFMNKEFKVEYAKKYNTLKVQSDIKYGTESALTAQINGAMADYSYRIELLNNHAKYISETIKTMDDMIYGVQNRIKLEELISGKY